MVSLWLRTVLLHLLELWPRLRWEWGGKTVQEFLEGACPAPLGEDCGEDKAGRILHGAGQQYRTSLSSLDKALGSPAPEGKLEVH